MKQQLTILLIASLISCGTLAKSAPYCDGTEKNPCLVQDTQDSQTAIKHFRYASMLADAYKGNITGLADLKMSGSGAPNTFEWNKILKIIRTETNNEVITVLDVDLRQETHGYLNDNAINLTSTYNWINLNKTLEEMNIAEHNWLQSISKNSTVDNVLTSAQFDAKDFTHGVTLPVKTISSEQLLVETLGYTYLRLPVTDHRTPLNTEIDAFVALVKHLPETTWLHIHCRGGKGRTTTFMAMYDMLKNADKVSFDDIIKRQAAVDPFYDLSDIQRSNPELSIYYKERYDFLKNFYSYAYATFHDYQGTWSEWVAKATSKHS